MIPGEITITKDLDEALLDIDEDLPQIARDVDKVQKTTISYQL